MLKLMSEFNENVMSMRQPWPTWMMLLVSVNLVVPLFFFGMTEAKVVLAGMVASIALMLALFSRFGYVKLLGLGHLPWLYTVPWLGSRLGTHAGTGLFYYWLLAVVLLDSISLVIDAVDVTRYAISFRRKNG